MKITIVGGGTAGWMAAAFLSKHHPEHHITIIDKENSSPVGVGEATVLDFKPFMDDCGFEFYDLLKNVDGAFKSGIMFPGWKRKDISVWHPFFIHVFHHGNVNISQWDVWAERQDLPFSYYGLPMLSVSEENKVDPMELNSYAYHVDCGKLIKYIESKINSYVEIVRSEVKEIVKNGKIIEKLILENGEEHHADLFLDCTGWANLLKTPDKVDLSDRLFCDTAVAGHVPYEDRNSEFRPYVISEAVDHGWIWKIPVQNRFGSGLVFNRSITDIETAKDYFVEHWDNRVKKEDLKVLKWDPYYIKNSWEGNVVSIGLSSGFIEPLESTGLAFMRFGIRKISEKISLGYWDENDANLYNTQMTRIYENTVDFINMHYSHSERTEDFWMYVRSKFKKTKVQEFYENYMKDPNSDFSSLSDTLLDSRMFNHVNWILWLIQLECETNVNNGDVPPGYVEEIIENFRKNEEIRCKRSISHIDTLEVLEAWNQK